MRTKILNHQAPCRQGSVKTFVVLMFFTKSQGFPQYVQDLFDSFFSLNLLEIVSVVYFERGRRYKEITKVLFPLFKISCVLFLVDLI